MIRNRKIIDLRHGISQFAYPCDLMAISHTSFYKNTYLPKRYDFMKRLETNGTKNNWEGVNGFVLGEFRTQVREVDCELYKLKNLPEAFPHNPSDLIRPIHKSIMAYYDGDLINLELELSGSE